MTQRSDRRSGDLSGALSTLHGLCLGLDTVERVDDVDEATRRRYAADLAAAVGSLARLQALLLDEDGAD